MWKTCLKSVFVITRFTPACKCLSVMLQNCYIQKQSQEHILLVAQISISKITFCPLSTHTHFVFCLPTIDSLVLFMPLCFYICLSGHLRVCVYVYMCLDLALSMCGLSCCDVLYILISGKMGFYFTINRILLCLANFWLFLYFIFSPGFSFIFLLV